MNARTRTTVRKLDEEVQPRQGEHEEAHVEVELGVLDTERLAVDPQEVGAPGAHRPRPGEQAQDDGDGDDRDPAQRLDGLAVLLEDLLGRGDRHVDRTGPVRGHERGGDAPTGDHRGEDEDDELRRQLLDEDPAEPDGVVPPDVGQQVGRDAAHDREADEDERGGQQGPAPARRAPRGTRARASVAVGAPGALVGTVGSVEPVRATHSSPRPVCRDRRAEVGCQPTPHS